jgi:hypothetical protein
MKSDIGQRCFICTLYQVAILETMQQNPQLELDLSIKKLEDIYNIDGQSDIILDTMKNELSLPYVTVDSMAMSPWPAPVLLPFVD